MKKKINLRSILIISIVFLFGCICASAVGYGATILYASNYVKYSNTSSGMTSTNVQSAIDELTTKSKDDTKIKNKLKELKAMEFPVGSIYISVTNTNPSSTLGGTWQAFGTGRTLVAVDTSQTEFSTVEKTGGDKNMQAHTHSFTGSWVERDIFTSTGADTYRSAAAGAATSVSAGSSGTWNFGCKQQSGNAYGTIMTVSGNMGSTGSGDSENLQPYITVYMWKRTA